MPRDADNPQFKQPSRKRKNCPSSSSDEHATKKDKADHSSTEKNSNSDACTVLRADNQLGFKFHAVDRDWGLPFHASIGTCSERPAVVLTRPDKRKGILGDGSCMFRSLSYVVTGSEDQHAAIRASIVQHMKDIEPLMLRQINSHPDQGEQSTTRARNQYSSIQEYLQKTKMEKDCTWGTDKELHICLRHAYTPTPRQLNHGGGMHHMMLKELSQ